MKNHEKTTFGDVFPFSYALMSAVQSKHAWDWRSISWRRTLLWECPYIPIYLISSMISNMCLRLETCPTMTRTRFFGTYWLMHKLCLGFLDTNHFYLSVHGRRTVSRPDSEIDTPLIVRDVSWNDTVVKSSKLHSVQHVIGISKVSQWFQSFYCTITAPICTHGCPHQFMTIQLHIDNQIDFWGKVEYMNISLVR